MDDVFMKIIRREIPADIVYEDSDTIAFLDIAPNNPGHTLVVPKKPIENIFDADDDSLSAVIKTVKRIAQAVSAAVSADGMNVMSNHGEAAGQGVPHLHFHVIPRFKNDGYKVWPGKKYKPGEASLIAEKIRVKLRQR